MSYTFNLTIEPWIPVRSSDGKLKLVNLQTVLVEAHLFERIEDPSPLVVAAIHRFLLAVLHRALEGPRDGAEAIEWLKQGRFSSKQIDSYLNSWRHQFDLFNPDRPFYQVADLTLEISRKPWTFLLPERSWGNKPLLFDHTRHDEPPHADPAEAARALLAHQTFVLGGLLRILGVTSAPDAPAARAALVVPLGETLFETLTLNLEEYPRHLRATDLAIWERDPLTVVQLRKRPSGSFLGPAQRYTWLSRGVHLVPEQHDGRIGVRWMAYGPGVTHSEGSVFDPDPMSAYRRSKQSGYFPLRFREGRGFWRDFLALLPHRSGEEEHVAPRVLEQAQQRYWRLHGDDRLIAVMVLGQASDQAKVLLWRSEVFPLRKTVHNSNEARDLIRWCLSQAEESGNALAVVGRHLARDLVARSANGPDPEEVSRLANTFPLLSQFWSALEAAFPMLLVSLVSGYDDAQVRASWLERLIAAARKAWNGTLQSIGTSAQAIRAAELADRVLGNQLRKLLDGVASLKAST